ncbi:Alkyl hydroperoxide reductase protein C [Pseudoalteromonas maricaloris]
MSTSLINTKIQPFNATAYHGGDFVEVSEQDLLGKWSIVFFYPADFTFVCP